MRLLAPATALLLSAVLGFACAGAGSSGPEPLTCEYLADPGNCWAAAAAELAACLPGAGEIGVLAPERDQCSFSNGAVVRFETPLPQTTDELERFAFTIERDGSECGGFTDTFENRMILTAGDATVVSQLRTNFLLDCGNEERYRSDFDLLFECEYGTQPTDGFEVTPDSVMAMILSINTPGELFRCEL